MAVEYANTLYGTHAKHSLWALFSSPDDYFAGATLLVVAAVLIVIVAHVVYITFVIKRLTPYTYHLLTPATSSVYDIYY